MIGLAKCLASTAAVSSYQVSISPKFAGDVGPPGGLTSNNVTCSVQNGVEPITYAWTKISGDDITVSNSSAKTVKFSASGINGQRKSAIFQCQATDNIASTDTDTVSVVFIFESGA